MKYLIITKEGVSHSTFFADLTIPLFPNVILPPSILFRDSIEGGDISSHMIQALSKNQLLVLALKDIKEQGPLDIVLGAYLALGPFWLVL